MMKRAMLALTSGFIAYAAAPPTPDQTPTQQDFSTEKDSSNFLEQMKSQKSCGVCATPETLSQMKGLLTNTDGVYRLPKKRKLTRPKQYQGIKYLYSSSEITPTGIHLGNFTDYNTYGASRRWIINRNNNAPKDHVPYSLRYTQTELDKMAQYSTTPELEEYEIDYDIPSDPVKREEELGTDTENDVPIILHDDGSISPLHCPTTYKSLSQATWTYLHTMAAYYSEDADTTLQQQTNEFLNTFAILYPCHHCKEHMVKYLREHPPQLQNNRDFSAWMCEYHNQVNAFLGKRLIQCSPDYLIHRYKDGYPKSANVQCNNDL